MSTKVQLSVEPSHGRIAVNPVDVGTLCTVTCNLAIGTHCRISNLSYIAAKRVISYADASARSLIGSVNVALEIGHGLNMLGCRSSSA